MTWSYRRNADDFAAVSRAWETSRPVLITGPSGIGKTTLARQFAASIDRTPMWVIGDPAAQRTPMAAVAAAVEVDGVDDATVLVDRLRAQLSGGAIVIVEAAEHLDEASAAVVARLVTSVAHVGIVTADGDLDPVLARALQRADAAVVAVTPLDLPSVTILVEGRLGGPIAVPDAVRLHRITEGNPLLVKEFVDGVVRAGSFEQSAGGMWRMLGAPAVTDGLRSAAAADRLTSATDAERRLIDLMSLCRPLPRVVVDYLGLGDGVSDIETGLVLPLADTVVPGHAIYPELRRAEAGILERRMLAAELVAALDAVDVGPVARLHRVRLSLEYDLPVDGEVVEATAATAFLMGDLPLAERMAAVAVGQGAGLGARLQMARALSAMGRSSEALKALADVDPDSLVESDLAGYAVTAAINASAGDGDHAAAVRVLDKFEPRIESAALRCSFAGARALAFVSEGDQPSALWWARRASGLVAGAPLWTTVGAYVEAEVLRRSGECLRPVSLVREALAGAEGAASLVCTGARRTLVQALVSDGDLQSASRVVDDLLDAAVLRHIPRAVACGTAALVDAAQGRFRSARRHCEDSIASWGAADRAGLGRGTAVQLAEVCAVTGDVAGARAAGADNAKTTSVQSGWSGVYRRLAEAFVLLAEGQVITPRYSLRRRRPAL